MEIVTVLFGPQTKGWLGYFLNDDGKIRTEVKFYVLNMHNITSFSTNTQLNAKVNN